MNLYIECLYAFLQIHCQTNAINDERTERITQALLNGSSLQAVTLREEGQLPSLKTVGPMTRL